MAFFGVTIETIEDVIKHPNADTLDVARLTGLAFEFVVRKGEYVPGERVLYFPIDSIIPIQVLTDFGMVKDGKGILAGKLGNRVKTKEIRGVMSRGIVAKLSHADKFDSRTGDDLTKFFGVEKYEPQAVLEKGANLLPLPQHVQELVGARYDIESTDRHSEVLDFLMQREVYVTEKLEGQNFSVTVQTGEVFVNQRNYTIKTIEGHSHTFWKIAEKGGVIAAAKAISANTGGAPVTIFGEFLGPAVQDNIYKLKEHQVHIFDIAVGGRFLNLDELQAETQAQKLTLVPVIFKGILADFLGGKNIKEVSGGKSVLFDTLREGIVIKPVTEAKIERFGRVIIKKRDEAYEALRG